MGLQHQQDQDRHQIKSQLLCTVLGLGMMFLFSYFDHRFLRRMVKLGYVVCLILLVLVLVINLAARLAKEKLKQKQ